MCRVFQIPAAHVVEQRLEALLSGDALCQELRYHLRIVFDRLRGLCAYNLAGVNHLLTGVEARHYSTSPVRVMFRTSPRTGI
jgi:hypothetical protein